MEKFMLGQARQQLYTALLDGYNKFKVEHVKAKFSEPKVNGNAKR